MARKLKQAVDERTEEIQTAETAAEDFRTLLDALPHGQIIQLYKDKTCAAILSKYGLSPE